MSPQGAPQSWQRALPSSISRASHCRPCQRPQLPLAPCRPIGRNPWHASCMIRSTTPTTNKNKRQGSGLSSNRMSNPQPAKIKGTDLSYLLEPAPLTFPGVSQHAPLQRGTAHMPLYYYPRRGVTLGDHRARSHGRDSGSHPSQSNLPGSCSPLPPASTPGCFDMDPLVGVDWDRGSQDDWLGAEVVGHLYEAIHYGEGNVV